MIYRYEATRTDGTSVEGTLEAESEARALEAKLQPWRAMDHRTILAMGMKALGENAAKIGNLTITPDLLSALLKDAAK